MKQLTLSPISDFSGELALPGSKSLSNRFLILAALGQGTTEVQNLLFSDDVGHMLKALQDLGLSVQADPNAKTSTLTGNGGPLPAQGTEDQPQELYLGNAGTAMRPLAAALCLTKGGVFDLVGEDRMYERPIRDLVDALRVLGADITYLKEDGYPPLRIKGTGLQAPKDTAVKIRGDISSQFLTALLMTAPLCDTPLTIEVDGELVSKPYIHITLECMKKFGVEVDNQDYQKFIVPQAGYTNPASVLVEGDASSASYFLAAAAIPKQTETPSPVRVTGVGRGSVQGDTDFAKALEAMGAQVTYGENYIEVVSSGKLQGVDMDMNHITDAAMTIATTALFAKGSTAIRNVANWRVKECDRLSAMATELVKVGAKVEEGEDYIIIHPPKQEDFLHGTIDTYNDHRMAMCFALAAFAKTGVTINDPDCTRKTFPDFFSQFQKMSRGA